MSELADQIRRVLKGEPAAFNTIVDRFQDMAVGYASTILGDVRITVQPRKPETGES